MTSWEKPLGIFMLFFFSFLGLVVFDDKKWKVISYFVGVISAITLLGWSNEILTDAQQLLGSMSTTIKPDAIGIVTSVAGLTLSPLIPSKSARRAMQSASISGLVLGLLGIPTWALWLLAGIVLVGIIVVLYYVIKKIGKWFIVLTRGGNKNGKE